MKFDNIKNLEERKEAYNNLGNEYIEAIMRIVNEAYDNGIELFNDCSRIKKDNLEFDILDEEL